MTAKEKISNLGSTSAAIKRAIAELFKEKPQEIPKIKPKVIINKMKELFADTKIDNSLKTMVSILLKKAKFENNCTTNIQLDLANPQLNELTKLALRLIVTAGGKNNAILAIETASRLIND